MRYMLLIYNDPTVQAKMSEAEQNANTNEYYAYTQELAKSGKMGAGEALMPATDATTVRVRNGKKVTTDGPFAETKEFLGGFYIVDCKDLDEAIEWAAKIPDAKYGSIEVRPIWEIPAQQSS
jgi:hypothetical protein